MRLVVIPIWGKNINLLKLEKSISCKLTIVPWTLLIDIYIYTYLLKEKAIADDGYPKTKIDNHFSEGLKVRICNVYSFNNLMAYVEKKGQTYISLLI